MCVVGLDEAGCGPAFGDLIASAVYIPDSFDKCGVDDSKKLSEIKRKMLYTRITDECMFGIGVVSNLEIDEKGLAECRRLVFERALEDFSSKYPLKKIEKILVDGTIFRQWKNIPFECIPQADSKYLEVSAASIIAKVTRDESIYRLCEENSYLKEYYCIEKNKGYLTKKHVEGIKKYGKTKFHRHSYNIKV